MSDSPQPGDLVELNLASYHPMIGLVLYQTKHKAKPFMLTVLEVFQDEVQITHILNSCVRVVLRRVD